jgi:pyruvate formate lyase activating enzyme
VKDRDFLIELEKCQLCEHRCKVNRLNGETGVCRVATPVIASATLHPAPPESYTVFMSGCNFKCLNCQNWTISQYPDNGYIQRGYEDPNKLAAECVEALDSSLAKQMRADRIFFSGGEATIHLPYIERVVHEARKIRPEIKVNFDTNGYMTENSLERILSFTTSITYDIKAYSDELFLALTGAHSSPVLRNAEYIGKNFKNKLWEFRILVIPKINENEIELMTEFIARIDPFLPVCFLAFRPNFILENHPGAGIDLMHKCVEIAKEAGLKKAYWSGHTGLPGISKEIENKVEGKYTSEEAQLSASYAWHASCRTHPRGCLTCTSNQKCEIKKYTPQVAT